MDNTFTTSKGNRIMEDPIKIKIDKSCQKGFNGFIIEDFINQVIKLGYRSQDIILEPLPNNEYKIKEAGCKSTIVHFKIIEETE